MPGEVDINEVRYKMFCRDKTPDPKQLPPTRDELLQHIKRSNYKSYIWKNILLTQLQMSAPQGHGWGEIDGKLEIVWMAYPPAPHSIMELITCNCRRFICNEDCQCRILLMECTDICRCAGNCTNIEYESAASDDEVSCDDGIDSNGDGGT